MAIFISTASIGATSLRFDEKLKHHLSEHRIHFNFIIKVVDISDKKSMSTFFLNIISIKLGINLIGSAQQSSENKAVDFMQLTVSSKEAPTKHQLS